MTKSSKTVFYGIYPLGQVTTSWAEATPYITHQPGRRAKKFKTYHEAFQYSKTGAARAIEHAHIEITVKKEGVSAKVQLNENAHTFFENIPAPPPDQITPLPPPYTQIIKALAQSMSALFEHRKSVKEEHVHKITIRIRPVQFKWASIKKAMHTGQTIETRRWFQILKTQLEDARLFIQWY